jgi:hypothetical protein
VTDVVCFLLLTPVTIASLDLCLRGIYFYASSTWEVAGLAILIFLLLLTYLLWLATCLYQHGQQFRTWRQNNVEMSLVPQDILSMTSSSSSSNSSTCYEEASSLAPLDAVFLV